jgi:copper(I)-binding protein
MNRIPFALAFAFSVLVSAAAQAEDISVDGIKISNPWVRATPKRAPVGGGYLTITNTGITADRLVGGASDASDKFEIHEMSMDHGVMKMRPLANGLEIKPGATIELKPGGYHLMFIGLKKPFEQGQQMTATLQFEKAGKVTVKFVVESMGAQSGGQKMQDMGGMKMDHGH